MDKNYIYTINYLGTKVAQLEVDKAYLEAEVKILREQLENGCSNGEKSNITEED